MTDLSPADELRLAAMAIRDRALAATPGPWTPMVLGSEGYLVLRKHGTIRERGRGRVGRFGCKGWDADRADAEYVASMHPLVAVAVADWLEAEADDTQTPRGEAEWPLRFLQALAVARAYMGATDG